MPYVIEPFCGWAEGDRAYCVRGSDRTEPQLVAGRVYQVTDVIPLPGKVGCGLAIANISLPNDLRGFYSSRFVKLLAGRRSLDVIDRHTTASWTEAYKVSTGQVSHQITQEAV